MKFGSLFSGVGGLDLGLERAGFECAWQAEKDKYCLKVLEEHFPDAERYDDVRSITRETAEPVDLICGGFPCQDVSVAGKRNGLSGARSGLWFEFERIIREFKPKWVLIENVGGLLSSNSGEDFRTIIQTLDELGYGVAWRVLDSQYFGVPQRRKRVFIVGSLGNTSCGEVLFEPESLSGDFAPSGEQRKEATSATLRSGGSGGIPSSRGENIVAYWDGSQTSDTLDVSVLSKGQMMPEKRRFPVIWEMHHASEVYRGLWTAQNRPETYKEQVAPTLQARMGTGGNNIPLVGVRKLTPLECERLQGFPDNWTASQSDTQRYRQMGNAVTVNVAEWVAKRIKPIADAKAEAQDKKEIEYLLDFKKRLTRKRKYDTIKKNEEL